jgi:lysophospholipase L1-like esterase
VIHEASLQPQGAAISKSPARAEGTNSWPWIILAVICLVALIDWFSASTRRLYIDEDSAAAQQEGTVWQHFGLRGYEVVPEIISRDEARFTFPISLSTRYSLCFTAVPEGLAEYEIFLQTPTIRRQIASQKIDRATSKSFSIPAGQGELKFIVHGRIAWFDLRLARQFHWPIYFALAVLAVFVIARRRSSRVSERTGNWLAFGISTVVCLAIVEYAFRALALKLPPAVVTARHDLGLAAPDSRWVESPRYRLRLRPNLKTYCEWQHGDIVRMGFLPPDLFGSEQHRYPFETDAEGFRNPSVREKIDIAALGDSFVDAMTSAREEAWPARLEEITQRRVQNYGTSSFGPQQELYVLQDYAVRHQPREVVLAFFSGNDLFDAERFDNWEQGGDKPGEEATGWRLKKEYRRFEALYLFTLARVALPAATPAKTAPAAFETDSGFDRGAFQVRTGQGTLRFAFMPPYLQKLASSRAEIERSRGWGLVRETLSRMRNVCAENGTRLTVMFIPSKDEVYWPLVERSLGTEKLQQSIDFVSSYNHMQLRVADIHANRLAQNELVRDFCADASISFLDLTPALENAAASGRAVYFPDDAHWNAAGHEIAAQELARFLATQP